MISFKPPNRFRYLAVFSHLSPPCPAVHGAKMTGPVLLVPRWTRPVDFPWSGESFGPPLSYLVPPKSPPQAGLPPSAYQFCAPPAHFSPERPVGLNLPPLFLHRTLFTDMSSRGSLPPICFQYYPPAFPLVFCFIYTRVSCLIPFSGTPELGLTFHLRFFFGAFGHAAPVSF